MEDTGQSYLYGPRHHVAINTLLFKDGDKVVEFINRATHADDGKRQP